MGFKGKPKEARGRVPVPILRNPHMVFRVPRFCGPSLVRFRRRSLVDMFEQLPLSGD